jgi:hypothetical protein
MLYKRALQDGLHRISHHVPGPSTSNEDIVAKPLGEPAVLVEMVVNDVQVPASFPKVEQKLKNYI